MGTISDGDNFLRAGRLIDAHAMFWRRTLRAPIHDVWRMVSTAGGLERWWIVPPQHFELRTGGAFIHHWNNTITGFREQEFIDFAEPDAAYAGTGGMRFELASTGSGSTVFTFVDTWGPAVLPPDKAERQPGGAGTPWPGVAAGWHHTMDRLERIFAQDAPHPPYESLCLFYEAYLEEQYRLRSMVERRSLTPDGLT